MSLSDAKMDLRAGFLSFFAVFVVGCEAYKHVILMHGLFGRPSEFHAIENFIKKDHPNTTVTAINSFDLFSSLLPMWHQANKIRDIMYTVMKDHPDGVHLLCYSQGGLVCRAVLETLPDHNVENFISLSSPQGGQYGDTRFLKYLFPHLLKKEMYKFFYSKAGQDIAIGNYWNDPHHQELYAQYSNFLAVLNNQSVPLNQTRNLGYRKNFSRLKNLVLIGGPDDEVITPWQSSQFGAFDDNETVVEMRQQSWYTEDWFGLRTLDDRKSIHTDTVPGPKHLDWPRNYTVFHKYIAPWLT